MAIDNMTSGAKSAFNWVDEKIGAKAIGKALLVGGIAGGAVGTVIGLGKVLSPAAGSALKYGIGGIAIAGIAYGTDKTYHLLAPKIGSDCAAGIAALVAIAAAAIFTLISLKTAIISLIALPVAYGVMRVSGFKNFSEFTQKTGLSELYTGVKEHLGLSSSSATSPSSRGTTSSSSPSPAAAGETVENAVHPIADSVESASSADPSVPAAAGLGKENTVWTYEHTIGLDGATKTSETHYPQNPSLASPSSASPSAASPSAASPSAAAPNPAFTVNDVSSFSESEPSAPAVPLTIVTDPSLSGFDITKTKSK